MFTDTHCHISESDYENIERIINESVDSSITKLINNASNVKTCKEVLKIAEKYKNVYAAIGIHPDSVDEFTKESMSFLEENIESAVAIGEIGLDYHYEGYDRKKQIELFEAQLELAQKYQKPVIIHSRDATEDTIKCLKKFPKVKGSIHCFSGSIETARIYIKMGYKLGFGGVATFKNSKLKNVLCDIPNEAILLETDSPYLSPEPVRGTQNAPKNVNYIAKYIAEVKGISLEELSEITESNVHNLFDI